MSTKYNLSSEESRKHASCGIHRSQGSAYTEPLQNSFHGIENAKTTNTVTVIPQIQDNDSHYLIVNGGAFCLEFNKHTGYLNRYNVAGIEMMNQDTQLVPNFWRAPTDNDFGAGLQQKFAVWRNPGLKLTSFKWETVNEQVILYAEYEMQHVSAKLNLTYIINNEGAVKVTQKW